MAKEFGQRIRSGLEQTQREWNRADNRPISSLP